MSPPIKVLFVCTANACRSQIAEAILRHLGKNRFQVFSAGVRPTDHIHPLAQTVAEAMGLSFQGQYSKGIETLSDIAFDIVVTVCDAAACLLPGTWRGHPIIVNWSLVDPVTFPGRDDERILLAHQVGRKLQRMLEAFVALPFERLDPAEIQNRLVRIGRVE